MLANVSLRTFLLPLVSIAALATQACAAPAGEPSSEDAPGAAEIHAPAAESDGDALAIAGSAGEIAPSGVAATLAAIGGARAGASNPDVVGQLVVPSRKATYDLYAYDLGIDAGTTIATGAGASAALPTVRPLTVLVEPKAGAPSLAAEVFGAGSLGDVTLMRRDPSGKWVELAKLRGASVTTAKTTVAGSTTAEQYAIGMTSLTVSSGASSVTVDLVKGSATCAAPCPCGTQSDAKLGPYVQATDPTWTIAKGAARVDAIDVAVSTVTPPPDARDVKIPRPQLDGLSFAGPFETSGMCAVLDAAKGAHASSVKLGVAAAPAPGGAARESTSWDACLAAVKSVAISSAWNGAYETIDLGAGGLVRTDRTFDAYGKELSSKTSGWSFVTNMPLASCSEVLGPL